jgi:hypothetical protein
MTNIVIIEKNCSVKQVNVKKLSRETLYSKCGFRKSDGFEKRTTWKVQLDETYSIELWAKDDGKANNENKYEFPPPVDKTLYFGNCCVVRIDTKTDDIVDFTKEEWKKVYEKLFGGFEDLVEEEMSEDELENIPENMKTGSGYLKDGFVVGTDSDSDTSGNNKLVDNKNDVGVQNKRTGDFDDDESEDDSDYDNKDGSESDDNSESDSELEEEDYCYSDDE